MSHPLRFHHAALHGWFGLAQADITPPVGVYARNWGAATHDVAESVHRPLTLTALAIWGPEQGTPLVLIDADLGWWKTPQTAQAFLARLQESLGLPAENLIFAITHTHSGPPLMEPDRSLPGADLLEQWMQNLLQQATDTVRAALNSRFEGTLEWDTGACRLAMLRDLPDPDPSRQRTVCGFNPQGTPDDTLLVGRLTEVTGRIRATLVNYACHPTVLAWQNHALSPDYIGALRETVGLATDAPVIFLLGVCGDLAPRYQYVGDPAVPDRHGRQLGHAVLSTLFGMEPPGTELTYEHTVESGAPLAVWTHHPRTVPQTLAARQITVELPLKDWPTAAELEHERATCIDRALEERLRRKRDIRRFLGDGASFALPIFVWRLGDAVLIGCCCEPYSRLQQELRRRFPDRSLICMNLINGSIGYLPPDELYDTDVYPVWQTPFDRGCLERTLETMTQAIEQVFRDD